MSGGESSENIGTTAQKEMIIDYLKKGRREALELRFSLWGDGKYKDIFGNNGDFDSVLEELVKRGVVKETIKRGLFSNGKITCEETQRFYSLSWFYRLGLRKY